MGGSMLKEAFTIGALVAAAVAPATASQAQDAQAAPAVATTTTSALGNCATRTASTSKPCKWMSEGDRRCFYCKQSKKKGGGWKRQYCEYKHHRDRDRDRDRHRGPQELECTTKAEPTQAQPKRTCETCVDAKTGRQVSKKCNAGT